MNAFHAIKVPDDIPRLAAESTQLDMVSVKCFCSQKFGKHISCFIDVGHRTAPFIARALGGELIGNATVSFVVAIPPDFSCHKRDGAQRVSSGTCICRRGYSRANPKLAR